VAIEEVVAGQVLKGRRTSLRAGSASQVFARSGTASEDKDTGHRPKGRPSVGHAFKACLPHKSSFRPRRRTSLSGARDISGPPGSYNTLTALAPPASMCLDDCLLRSGLSDSLKDRRIKIFPFCSASVSISFPARSRWAHR
jgi:hypothetical protein